MGSFAWESVAQVFTFEGIWLDIYIFDTNLDSWQGVLNRLRSARYDLIYYRCGIATALPLAAADAFPAEGEADRMLSVRMAGFSANCHFFCHDEIEFDVDPREFKAQAQLDALLEFMRLLSDATGKDAVLTPENMREKVIFRSSPSQAAVEYRRENS